MLYNFFLFSFHVETKYNRCNYLSRAVMLNDYLFFCVFDDDDIPPFDSSRKKHLFLFNCCIYAQNVKSLVFVYKRDSTRVDFFSSIWQFVIFSQRRQMRNFSLYLTKCCNANGYKQKTDTFTSLLS